MEKGLISAIMPVYNGEKYLAEAIESVLNQTYERFEYIIVDDGSSDSTLDIIQQYMLKDKRIICIINDINCGVAESLNRGIRQAKGEYIARIDADDVCDLHRFEIQKDYLDNNSEIDVLASGYIIDDGKNCSENHPYILCDDEIKAAFICRNSIPHPTVMCRMGIFNNLGFSYDPEYKLEDFDLWTRLAKQIRFAIIPQMLIRKREHSESTCATMGEDYGRNISKIIRNYIKYIWNLSFDIDDAHFNKCNLTASELLHGEDAEKYICDEENMLLSIECANSVSGAINPLYLSKWIKSKWNWNLLTLGLYKRGWRFLDVKSTTTFKDELKNKEKSVSVSDSKEIIVYGMGQALKRYFVDGNEWNMEKISAFCDKSADKIGRSFNGVNIITPKQIEEWKYELIVVTSKKYFSDIRNELINIHSVNKDRIRLIDDVLKPIYL